jgi:tRNA pseudouridine13 synthase
MEFITTTKPLKARVKERYADFIVEEIYKEGEEVKKCAVDKYNLPFEQRINKNNILTIEENSEYEQVIVEMEKINTDTNTAIALIARGIGVSKNRIGYSGLKDKRGITCQRISLYKPNLEKLKKFGVKGVELKNARWAKERLELGDLIGNEFKITLRDISENEEEIKEIITSFEHQIKEGIPNFFGNQRFGGKRMITHKVGKLLLKEDYEKAIKLYLTETYAQEKIELKNARINLSKSYDYAKALKEFPRKDARTELAILNVLVKEPNNYQQAFHSLPKKTRYLFIHAYQSHLFNKMIEKRIDLLKENSLKKIDGDILINDNPTAALIGYQTEFAEGIQGEIEKQILQEENMTKEDFIVKGQSELSSQGNRKEILLKVKNFKLQEIIDDEYNPGKKAVTITFFLDKGNYATTVLKELLKEEVY